MRAALGGSRAHAGTDGAAFAAHPVGVLRARRSFELVRCAGGAALAYRVGIGRTAYLFVFAALAMCTWRTRRGAGIKPIVRNACATGVGVAMTFSAGGVTGCTDRIGALTAWGLHILTCGTLRTGTTGLTCQIVPPCGTGGAVGRCAFTGGATGIAGRTLTIGITTARRGFEGAGLTCPREIGRAHV